MQIPYLVRMAPGGGDNETYNQSDETTSTSGFQIQNPKQKKQDMIFEILREVGKVVDGKKTQNIAIIGPPGVGKSSTINTIAAAFSDKKWREHAYSGFHGGDNKQVTYYTKSYQKHKYLEDRVYSEYCMPTFIDIAGFQNEENETIEEILRIVFFGRLPEEESLKDAMEEKERNGIEGLKQKYLQNKEELKVDRIIFVASATENVPKQLISCVIKAARPSGGEKAKGKRVIPIFGVLTKCDKVDLDGDAEAQERENEFIEALGLRGSTNRYMRCENYCDDVDKKHGIDRTEQLNYNIDLNVLKFMTQLCDPVYEVYSKDQEYEDTFKNQKPLPVQTIGQRSPEPAIRQPDLDIEQTLPSINLLIICAIKGALIAVLLFWFLSPQIDTTDLSNICVKHDSYKGMPNYNMPELDKICAKKHEITSRPLIPPLICFIVVIVGTDFFVPQLFRIIGVQ
ncbi:hypothetical protein KUTeg_006433 [Tegillarca granosa]|uniref:G domain-containing protein n=1 Tax=Tegillarca granosa TaxID=220873 RepID=A0ABQ9FGI2_TEGGR|nr:hypothetical protein KUTeg_006433 [Tegillarca granosa]